MTTNSPKVKKDPPISDQRRASHKSHKKSKARQSKTDEEDECGDEVDQASKDSFPASDPPAY